LGGEGLWIASTPLHNIICVQAQPHKLIIFTILAIIKNIFDNYKFFYLKNYSPRMSKVIDIMFISGHGHFFLVPSGKGHVFESVEFKKNSYYCHLSENPISIYWSTKFIDGKGTIICIYVVKQK